MKKTQEAITGPQENPEVVKRIAMEILEPSMQKALAKARESGTDQEVISALANCYAGLLVDIMGRKAAATFLQSHAVHLVSVEESVVND